MESYFNESIENRIMNENCIVFLNIAENSLKNSDYISLKQSLID